MWTDPVATPSWRGAAPPANEEPLGEQLKSYFDRLTEGPTPERLVRLTEALEAAFERGEL